MQVGTILDPWTLARDFLYPFYRRTIQAVSGVRDGLPTCNTTAQAYPVVPINGSHTPTITCAYPDLGVGDVRHLFFLEPSAIRNILDFSPQVRSSIRASLTI